MSVRASGFQFPCIVGHVVANVTYVLYICQQKVHRRPEEGTFHSSAAEAKIKKRRVCCHGDKSLHGKKKKKKSVAALRYSLRGGEGGAGRREISKDGVN